MRNEVHLKTFWYGLCENAWFPWQHPYMVFENGTKIGVKLTHRHMSFFLWSDM